MLNSPATRRFNSAVILADSDDGKLTEEVTVGHFIGVRWDVLSCDGAGAPPHHGTDAYYPAGMPALPLPADVVRQINSG